MLTIQSNYQAYKEWGKSQLHVKGKRTDANAKMTEIQEPSDV